MEVAFNCMEDKMGGEAKMRKWDGQRSGTQMLMMETGDSMAWRMSCRTSPEGPHCQQLIGFQPVIKVSMLLHSGRAMTHHLSTVSLCIVLCVFLTILHRAEDSETPESRSQMIAAISGNPRGEESNPSQSPSIHILNISYAVFYLERAMPCMARN